MALSEATQLQNRASDSGKSTWLSANAGSGKTRVLTDRVARLLLKGVSPQSVLCLTYTKAAASEMQNRLFKRLGAWAMLPDTDLRLALQELGETADVGLTHARTLFARAIETPGGLRIQTIHSFCAGLLRRFPIEAGVSPHFIEMDEIAQSHLISDIIEDMADETAPDAIEALARHLTGEDAATLARSVVSHRGAFRRTITRDEVAVLFGLPAGADERLPLTTAFRGSEAELVRQVLPEIRNSAAKTMQTLAHALEDLGPLTPSVEALDRLARIFLKSDANVPKTGSILTKSVQKALGPLCDELYEFMHRVADAQTIRAALVATDKTLALFTFAQAFLPQYEHQKHLRGWMDFDDLISKTEDLLSDPAAAAWVLFRLDGSFDHVLVDEAQDTSPAQWRIIDLLTQDLGSGIGARPETPRTVFVVGDKKQSIYSFQGADPEAFDQMFEQFRSRLFPQGGLQRMQLLHSFRSARAILEAADATFDGAASEGLGREVRHRAFHETMPGRVDLWPVQPKPEKPEETAWYDPVDMPTPNHESVVLAELIASEIKRLTADETETIPCQNGKFRRRIEPGDFLILVRSRSGAKEFFHKIIRACKARGLPIAGADRLRIADELAVKDLRSLLAFLALPEDDLALAEALRSPIFGWSEEMLFALATRRGKAHLWQALRERKAEHQATYDILHDLRRQSDFLRPYDLLERILIRHEGRANLLARLGREAEDSIDELLNQALSYERQDIPSLTGFLAWLETDDSFIKREMDSSGNLVRVMTVHGAKGLEAPIVILPQTLSGRPQLRDQILLTEAGLPLWKQRASEMPQAMIDAKDATLRRDFLEQQRLLYVAMTRAENWLIVCGAGDRPKTGDTWYDTVEAGLEKLDTEARDFPTGQGMRYETGHWSAAPMATAQRVKEPGPPLPAFFRMQATEPRITPPTLSPSDLGGAKALAGDTAATSEEDAKQRGRQIHTLLETLPAYPRESWPRVATELLAFGEDAAPEETAKALCAEAAQVLEAPGLAHIFAENALTEVEITAPVGPLQDRVILGAIDRLIVEESRVLAVDFKSNEIVPERPDQVPEGILRQMGAYAAALAALYPGKTVETAIVWTRTAAFMPLSHETVISALERTTTS